MRKHVNTLSMGNGEKSELEMFRLVDRLREAFSTHSGLQQGQGRIEDSVLDEGKAEIQDTVLDIAAALGVNVKLLDEKKEKEPYKRVDFTNLAK